MDQTKGAVRQPAAHRSPTESDRGASNGSAPSNDGAPKLSDIEIPLESAIESNVLHGVGQPSSSTFLGILKKFSPWSKPASADRKDVAEIRADSSEIDATDVAGGIHEITRATNYWFDREVGVLERDARALATEWAGKGLPRHDVVRHAPLEVEQFLAGRCTETFRQWVDRVRVKMRDQIARQAQAIGGHLGDLRAATGRIERLESEIGTIDRRVQELRAETREDAVRVGFEPIAPSKSFFWLFAVALTIVEFFANFPVFRLLLPMKPALAKAAEAAAQESIGGEWWAGFALQAKEIALHADALFVALVAVLVLVLFGKTLGGSARVLVALKPEEQPLASTTIVGIRRQHWMVLAGCVIGSLAVLTFLFVSRGRIATVAAARVTADSLELERLVGEARQAREGDLASISRAAAEIREQRRTLEIHRDDRAYATGVQNNNTPLALFNVGLIFAAAVLGFLTHRQIVSDGKGEHQRLFNSAPTVVRCRRTHTLPYRQGETLNLLRERESAARNI